VLVGKDPPLSHLQLFSFSKPNTIEQNDTSDDGEVDGNHRFKDVSITEDA